VSGTGVAAVVTDPAIAVAPTTLAFGDVAVGASGSQTFTISNTGNATLTGSVAVAAATSSEFSASPTTFSIAAGGQPVTVTATYVPTGTGTDSGALTVTSNVPARPALDLTVSGTGVEQGDDDDGGCSSGGSASWVAVVALALLAARRARRAAAHRRVGRSASDGALAGAPAVPGATRETVGAAVAARTAIAS
jgi:hypothetical protein